MPSPSTWYREAAMHRLLVALLCACLPYIAVAAQDPQVMQLEQDVRELRRQLQAQEQAIATLQQRINSAATASQLQSVPQPPPARAQLWLDAAKWRQVRPGMTELEVITLLGPPTSTRVSDEGRTLHYAIEIGTAAFLAGQVTCRNGLVVSVEIPALR